MEKARLVSQTYRRMVRLRAFERALLLEAAPPPASSAASAGCSGSVASSTLQRRRRRRCQRFPRPRPRPRRRSTRRQGQAFFTQVVLLGAFPHQCLHLRCEDPAFPSRYNLESPGVCVRSAVRVERRAATASESRPMEPVAYLTSWMDLGPSMNRDADSVVRASRVQYMVVIGLRAVVTGSVCIDL